MRRMGLMGLMEESGESGLETVNFVFVDDVTFGGFIQALENQRKRFG